MDFRRLGRCVTLVRGPSPESFVEAPRAMPLERCGRGARRKRLSSVVALRLCALVLASVRVTSKVRDTRRRIDALK